MSNPLVDEGTDAGVGQQRVAPLAERIQQQCHGPLGNALQLTAACLGEIEHGVEGVELAGDEAATQAGRPSPPRSRDGAAAAAAAEVHHRQLPRTSALLEGLVDRPVENPGALVSPEPGGGDHVAVADQADGVAGALELRLLRDRLGEWVSWRIRVSPHPLDGRRIRQSPIMFMAASAAVLS